MEIGMEERVRKSRNGEGGLSLRTYGIWQLPERPGESSGLNAEVQADAIIDSRRVMFSLNNLLWAQAKMKRIDCKNGMISLVGSQMSLGRTWQR